MQLVPHQSWKLEFAKSADIERYREIVRKVQEEAKRDRKQRDDKEKEKDREERRAELSELADVMVMASAVEVEAFHVTLDHYDTATYEAIIANEELLASLYRERDDMLAKAYVLPDGRRVFESEDGLRVFDEFGTELDASLITPEEIEDWRPKAERFQSNDSQIDDALSERSRLVEYQQQLDEARERAKEGEITAEDLKALEQDLTEDMPDAVRERLLPEHRPPAPRAEIAQEPDRTPVAAQRAPIHDAPTFT
jgi:agmatine/peptidylarginine deiminase